MEVTDTVKGLREGLARRGAGSVGFVPTMGALHEGHLSLVRRAREENDTVVASIFVNPTQFNDPEDLLSYPRMEGHDLALLREAGADVVFTPSESEVYPEPDTRTFDFGPLDKVMEGPSRPGHFNGVAQVVSRLFDAADPDRSYFGEKDFQQVAIIREMVRRLGYRTSVVACPIVREEDGLAMSSRNMLLSPDHRKAAPAIYRALSEAARRGVGVSVAQTIENVTKAINGNPLLEVEYFRIVNADTLQDVTGWDDPCPKRGCVVVRAGGVRLIDNIRL